MGGVPRTVCGPEFGGAGPVLAPDSAEGRHLGAELSRGGLWGRWIGRLGDPVLAPGAVPAPQNHAPPFPRPSDFVLDLSQSSGTQSGLHWVALGTE